MFLGVDLGQAADFTAVAVVELVESSGDWDPAVYAWKKKTALWLRYLERAPLGTPYPDVAERVAAITRNEKLAGRCQLAVDATGVGRPVVDGASVLCEVEEIAKDKKVVTLKTRRRKNSKSLVGFRRQVTILRVLDIAVAAADKEVL